MLYLSASQRNALGRVFRWAVLAFGLNALWEIAQLPLYSLWHDPSVLRIVFYVVHCLLGDVMIATALFVLAAALLRDVDWVLHRPWLGGMVTTTAGMGFTVFSEWYNVYVAGGWAYASSMPTIGGIGLTPLFQWLVMPVLLIVLTRRFSRAAARFAVKLDDRAQHD